jgi:hypothetical protein
MKPIQCAHKLWFRLEASSPKRVLIDDCWILITLPGEVKQIIPKILIWELLRLVSSLLSIRIGNRSSDRVEVKAQDDRYDELPRPHANSWTLLALADAVSAPPSADAPPNDSHPHYGGVQEW